MGRYATRSVFAAALCTGVAMVGTAVHGMLGVDAELQRSAFAADQQRTFERVAYQRPFEDGRHVVYKRDGNCEPPRSNHLS